MPKEKHDIVRSKERNSVLIRVIGPVLVLLFFVIFSNGGIVRDVMRRGTRTVNAQRINRQLQSDVPNMVDERVELLSVIFRLARRAEYSEQENNYQFLLSRYFPNFLRHRAVLYAQQVLPMSISRDAVFHYAVHLSKNSSGHFFISDMNSLLRDERWTRELAENFLPLVNSFYLDVSFSSFFLRCLDFYRIETERFIAESYSHVDFEWFNTLFGNTEMRVIYSPASTSYNYAAMYNNIAYVMISGDGSSIIQELSRNFANPIALRWYNENPDFYEWSNNSFDSFLLPLINTGELMAKEYLTRAYTTLYEAEHGRMALPLLLTDRGRGFRYMEEVYALITPHEVIQRGSMDIVHYIAGTGISMGPLVVFDMLGFERYWNVLSSTNIDIDEFLPSYISIVYRSQTGDVLYVNDSYLLVDLGSAVYQGRRGYRKYARIPLVFDA